MLRARLEARRLKYRSKACGNVVAAEHLLLPTKTHAGPMPPAHLHPSLTRIIARFIQFNAFAFALCVASRFPKLPSCSSCKCAVRRQRSTSMLFTNHIRLTLGRRHLVQSIQDFLLREFHLHELRVCRRHLSEPQFRTAQLSRHPTYECALQSSAPAAHHARRRN